VLVVPLASVKVVTLALKGSLLRLVLATRAPISNALSGRASRRSFDSLLADRALLRQGERAEGVVELGIDAEHVDVSEEVHHERIGGMLEDLGPASHLLVFSLAHDDDPVGDLEGLVLVVGHEHAGDVNLVVEPPQPLSGKGARECHALELELRAPCSWASPLPRLCARVKPRNRKGGEST